MSNLSLYNKLKNISPNSDEDWDTLRSYIKEVQNIVDSRNITIYNNDLKNYYKLTWRGSQNGTKKNFLLALQELKSTALHLGI